MSSHNLVVVCDLNSPTYVIGEIPERTDSGPSQSTEGSYTCVFGMRQYINDRDQVSISTQTELFQGGSSTEGTTGWITEGTNQNGKVDTLVERIGIPTSQDDTQSWMENRASNTAGKLWPNFAVETGVEACENTRNPINYIELGC